jgi:hypothetical protein
MVMNAEYTKSKNEAVTLCLEASKSQVKLSLCLTKYHISKLYPEL